jgi:hypothetical protein
LNNQHIAEPTWYYLERLAVKKSGAGQVEWQDLEGNVLLRQPVGSRTSTQAKKPVPGSQVQPDSNLP